VQEQDLEWVYVLLVLLPIVIAVANGVWAYRIRKYPGPFVRRSQLVAFGQMLGLFLGTCVIWWLTAAPFMTYISVGHGLRIASMPDVDPKDNIWFVDILLNNTLANFQYLWILLALDLLIFLLVKPEAQAGSHSGLR
jgi:hypothetical protein